MSPTSPTAEPPDGLEAEATTEPAEPIEPTERASELRLARLHLRTGSLGLARAELETLAGAGALDDEALLDLAEVRWRTDDLTGAGEAAAAYIAGGRIALIALVVAAEATAALGRPGEARRLAARALEMVDGAIDPVFAGMPRSDVWPKRQVERVASSPANVATVTVSTASGGLPAAGPPIETPVASVAAVAGAGPIAAAGGTAAGSPAPASPTAGPIEVAVPMAAAEAGRDAGEPMPDPQGELAAARTALAAGDRSGAAIRLSIVLRLAPSLAPAVLDLAAAEPGPEFDLVRGDALRLVGRESQARRSFAAAAVRRPTGDPQPAAQPESDVAADTASSEPAPSDAVAERGEPES